MREHDELKALRELHEIWGGLRSWAAPPVMDKHFVSMTGQKAFRSLLEKAQVLYGRTSHLIAKFHWTRSGVSIDALQHVLCQHDLVEARADPLWNPCWGISNSAIQQAIGWQEGQIARTEQQGLSLQVVSRWRYVIVALERIRVAANWPFSRMRFFVPLVAKVERWPFYRLVSVLADFGGLIGLIILLIAVASLLGRCL
jgi:hypothetical protein